MSAQPLSYGQAYRKVCPDGNGRNPTDQERRDILELMRQSGHLFPQERVGSNLPQKPKTVEDLKDWSVVPAAREMKPLTKHEFLSVKVNRDAFEAHLELHSKK
jgi:hypothetical protein